MNAIEQQKLRWRIVVDTRHDHSFEQYQKRRNMAVHAVLFSGFALLCLLFFLNEAFWRQYMTLPRAGDLLFLLLVWLMIFLAHLTSFYMYERYQRRIADQYTYDKPKRLLLSEEGEVLKSDDENSSDSYARGNFTQRTTRLSSK